MKKSNEGKSKRLNYTKESKTITRDKDKEIFEREKDF